MKNQFLWVLAVFLVFLLAMNIAFAGDSDLRNEVALYQTLESRLNGGFDNKESQLKSLWQKTEAENQAKWDEFEREITEKWGYFHPTTNTQWVKYSNNKNAVNVVDFRNGKVSIEVLVPKDLNENKQRRILTKQLEQVLTAKDFTGKPFMQDMLKKEEITGEIKRSSIDKGLAKGEIIKISTTFDMVPDHIAKRAARYFNIIQKEAEHKNLDTALVLAVIHTESAFNPMARSNAPAYGLMQLTPRWGAKEAYLELYGIERVLSPAYLYQPANNIKLGTTYLKILDEKYFKQIDNPAKRRYLVICAYNWGPTVLKNKLLSKIDIEEKNLVELYEKLQEKLPQETKDYLKRVEQRVKLYRNDSRFSI